MNPVLAVIRGHVTTHPGDAQIEQALNELAIAIAEPPEAHTHQIDDVVGLPEAIEEIRTETVSSVDPIPDTLVKRNSSGEIDNDSMLVGEIKPQVGTDTIFVAGSIDMQGRSVLNSNLSQRYEFNQSVPSTEWIISHGLNRSSVAITVFNSAGKEVLGTHSYIDDNTSRVVFSAAFSGRAVVIG